MRRYAKIINITARVSYQEKSSKEKSVFSKNIVHNSNIESKEHNFTGGYQKKS